MQLPMHLTMHVACCCSSVTLPEQTSKDHGWLRPLLPPTGHEPKCHTVTSCLTKVGTSTSNFDNTQPTTHHYTNTSTTTRFK